MYQTIPLEPLYKAINVIRFDNFDCKSKEDILKLACLGVFAIIFGGAFTSWLFLVQDPGPTKLDPVLGGFLLTQCMFVCLLAYIAVNNVVSNFSVGLLTKGLIVFSFVGGTFICSLFGVYIQAVLIMEHLPYFVVALYNFVPVGAFVFITYSITAFVLDALLLRKAVLIEQGRIKPNSLSELNTIIDHCVCFEKWNRAAILSKKLVTLAEHGWHN